MQEKEGGGCTSLVPSCWLRIPPPAAPGGGLSDARVRGGRCGDACVHRLYIPPWHRRWRSHRSEEPAADSTPAGRKSALIFHPGGAWLGLFFFIPRTVRPVSIHREIFPSLLRVKSNIFPEGQIHPLYPKKGKVSASPSSPKNQPERSRRDATGVGARAACPKPGGSPQGDGGFLQHG